MVTVTKSPIFWSGKVIGITAYLLCFDWMLL